MDDVYIGKGRLTGKGVYAARNFEVGEIVKYYNLTPLAADTEALRTMKNYLEGSPLHEFRKAPEFGGESELWKQIHAGQEYLSAIGERVVADNALRERLRTMKQQLNDFLTGASDSLDTGDAELDIAFRQYRDARDSARIIIHKTDEEIRQEVHALLEKL